MVSRNRALVLIVLLFVLATGQARTGAQSAPTITTPKQQLGANIGDDYGTFKFLFNGIYCTKAMPPRAGETSQTAQ